jgi:hypothetical protein
MLHKRPIDPRPEPEILSKRILRERIVIMKTTAIVMIILLCFSVSSLADTLKDEDEVMQFADLVVETAVDDGVATAIGKMKPFVQLNAEDLNALAVESKDQRDDLEATLGKSIGYEFVGIERVGTCLMKLQYIEKTERHALPWDFYFYRTEQGWTLNDFYWHGDLRRLFSELVSTPLTGESN